MKKHAEKTRNFSIEKEEKLKGIFLEEEGRCLALLFVLKQTDLAIEMGIIQTVMKNMKLLLLLKHTESTTFIRGFESGEDFIKDWPVYDILRIEVICNLVFSMKDNYEALFKPYFSQAFKILQENPDIELREHRSSKPYGGWDDRIMIQWKEYFHRSISVMDEDSGEGDDFDDSHLQMF